MNTAIATRLLWKEYRQQRNLWIALLFGATLLQGIFWFFIESRPSELHELLTLHIGAAALMTGLFAVCSAAISFAIEREEGTHLRLVSLSCPPALTLSVKFAVGLLGTLLLFAVSAAIGISLSAGFETFAEEIRLLSRDERIVAAYSSVVAVCGGLICGAFFSLLFRKVLPAVIAACVVSFIAGPILYTVWADAARLHYVREAARLSNPESIWFMVILLAGIGVVGLIDFLLVRWWMNRGFSDSPKMRERSLFRRVRVQRDGLDGSVTLEIGGADRAAFEVLTPDQARILPPPRLGLSLLYNNWGRGRSRVLRFLCWKEAAESRRLFLAMWGIGLILAIASGMEARSLAHQQYARPDWMPFAFTVTIVSMFVCGLMTFRGEQSQDSYRLLSDHGVTPGYVWVSKQIVWLGRLFSIPLTMLAIYAVIIGTGQTHVAPRAVFRSPQDWNNLPPLWWLTDCLKVLAILLTFYSITQMASLTWRRAALSIFFALLCCVLMGMWLGAASHFDVPVVIAGLPIAPALLLLTRLRTRGWLIGDDRFKRWLLPGSVGVLGVAACWLSTATWRIYEIPAAERLVATRTLDDGSAVETINGLTADERAAILAPVNDEEAATAALYQQFGAVGTDTLATCREAAARSTCAFGSPESEVQAFGSFTRTHMKDFAERLLKQAKLEVGNGNPEEALKLHREAFAIARHAAGRGVNGEYDRWRVITDSVLSSLAEWSRSESVTQELVDSAAKLVSDHIAQSPDLFAVSFAHHRVLRNTLELPVDQQLERRGTTFYSNDEYFFDFMSVKFPGTHRRTSRLLDWHEARTARLIAEAQQLRAGERAGDGSLGEWFRRAMQESQKDVGGLAVAEHRRWVQTTPLAEGLIDDVGISLVHTDVAAETRVRGTQIAMRLNLARREAGELPESLDELEIADDVLIEPWSGRQFAWYPEGIPNEIKSGTMTIPANTPFLFSGGPQDAYLEEIEESVRVEGPFDPPAKVIPLNSAGGDSAADGQANAGDAAPQNPVAQLTEPRPGLDAENQVEPADPFGIGGFGEMAGGMGAAMDSNIRWETRRRFVLKLAEPQTGPVDVAPTVWLFPQESRNSDSGEPELPSDTET